MGPSPFLTPLYKTNDVLSDRNIHYLCTSGNKYLRPEFAKDAAVAVDSVFSNATRKHEISAIVGDAVADLVGFPGVT